MSAAYDDHITEQTSTEEPATTKAKATETLLAVKTIALVTGIPPMASIDEEITEWEKLLGEWKA